MRFAAVIDSYRHSAARTGMGAVMGSKNLKGIAVRGSKSVPVANSEKIKELAIYFKNTMMSNCAQRDHAEGVLRYTSIGLFEHMDNAGLDLVEKVIEIIYPALCNTTKTPDIIKKLLDNGEYGLKTGHGMLDWTRKDIADFRKRCITPYYKYFNWKLPEKYRYSCI